MRVKEVMKKTVRTIAGDRPVSEAAGLMKQFGIGHLVVTHHHEPIGILTDGDILRHPDGADVQAIMTRTIITVDADERVSRAANLMRGHDIKSLVVTNEGKLAGIVTSSDVLEVVSRSGHKERMILRDRGPRPHR